MFKHTMTVPTEVWEFFQIQTGKKNPSDLIRNVLVQYVHNAQQNGSLNPERQALLNLCDQLDVDPKLFEPDPRDTDPEYQHVRNKKRWLLRGYRCEGMNAPERTLAYIVRDIEEYPSWSDLGPSGQASYRALQDKYRQWNFSNWNNPK